MKANEQCLACLVNQMVKTARLTNAADREKLYSKVFAAMSEIDYNRSNPEIAGDNFRLIKEHIGNSDPYKETKARYNQMFLEKLPQYDERIRSFEDAVKYAVVANIIDFNPVHSNVEEETERLFSEISSLTLTVDDSAQLKADILNAKTLLYLGDNCGEICFDKLLIKRIKELNPSCRIYFAVRGEAVINDNTEADAYSVGMDEYAEIISNGDYSPGTALERVSAEFKAIYDSADVVISKGQGNCETLSGEDKNIYFLLMTKCNVVADYVGVKEKSLVCLHSRAFKGNVT